MSVESLRKQVRQADAAYRAGAAVMSDAEFDALVAELRAVAPYAPELHTPGGGTALLSLDNCPLEDWWSGAPVVVQPKIDGAAVGLRYVGGELRDAWTRSGRDCMAVLRDLVPAQVPIADVFEVRGELWGHDGRQSTPATALRRMKGGSGGLTFTAFGGAFQEATEVNAMARLEGLGFDCVDSLLCTRLSEVQGLHAKWRERKLWDRPWPTDGVVVKVIDREVQFQMGESSRAPWWALAVK
jgi:NAD-dependent DNA ligase